MAKSGREHTARLNDGRDVFIEERRVADVTSNPVFRRVVVEARKGARALLDTRNPQ